MCIETDAYVLAQAGAVSYAGHTDYTGSLLSLGFSYLQLDLGFRPHWFSPFTDSSMLMSTESPTMPSATISNYDRISPFGIHYELFAARMSYSNQIVFGDGLTAGHPRLAGLHLDMEPAQGWSLGVSRLFQYGGGARGGGLSDLFHAFFNPVKYDNVSAANGAQEGNQEASITSTLSFPGRVPFAFYVEYAGEDTSAGKNYLLGNSSLSVGIHFPKLAERFDLTLEATEWQNAWYVHNVYLDGLTNYGHVIGNWFGDQRVFNDDPGGRSATIALGYEPPFGGQFQLRYRTLQNQDYTGQHYKTFEDVSLVYSRPWLNSTVGAQLDAGRDVFGQNFTRVSGFLRYDNGSGGLLSTVGNALSADSDSTVIKQGELFVDLGGNANRDNIDLTDGDRHNAPIGFGYHAAIGARRFVSDHSDLGARIEADNVGGHSLLGVRLLDYRYRFHGPLAFSLFLGAARYNLATPAYGFYYGGGLTWRNVIPGWDIGADVRYAESVARDHLLPSDPPNDGSRNDSFYNILSTTLSISRHF